MKGKVFLSRARGKRKNKGKRMDGSEKLSETESEEEFFDTENKEDINEEKMQEVKILIFDGQEYSNWKKRILMYLKMKKCEIVVTRAKTESDKVDWDEKGVQAINYIYSTISNK